MKGKAYRDVRRWGSGVVTERASEDGLGVSEMSRRAAAWFAWSMCAFSLALTGGVVQSST